MFKVRVQKTRVPGIESMHKYNQNDDICEWGRCGHQALYRKITEIVQENPDKFDLVRKCRPLWVLESLWNGYMLQNYVTRSCLHQIGVWAVQNNHFKRLLMNLFFKHSVLNNNISDTNF